ncbi:hypothetical protein OAO01_07845 [Oligoflexia bacterium]|nr:hypothetical protein [Oligoflexia bacterium]
MSCFPRFWSLFLTLSSIDVVCHQDSSREGVATPPLHPYLLASPLAVRIFLGKANYAYVVDCIGYGMVVSMSRYIFFAMSLCCLLSLSAAAEPLRWGVIINQSEKLCSNFWEGDECVTFAIEPGWSAIFPLWDVDTQKSFIVYEGKPHEGKRCEFNRSGVAKTCACLGLKFVSDTGAQAQPTEWSRTPGTSCDPKTLAPE